MPQPREDGLNVHVQLCSSTLDIKAASQPLLLICRELLVRGANVNARNEERKTPLHLAVLNEDQVVAQALCDHGGLVNAADEDGLTALHVTANQGLLELAQELIARGADVNARRQARPCTAKGFNPVADKSSCKVF